MINLLNSFIWIWLMIESKPGLGPRHLMLVARTITRTLASFLRPDQTSSDFSLANWPKTGWSFFTVEHLKQVKYSNSLFSSNNQKLDDIKSVCSSPIASSPQVSPSSPTSWSDFVKKSLNEHDYDVAAADCVLLFNVEERAYDNLGERAAKEVLNTSKVSSNVVVRANRLGKTNTNKDSKPRPIELKLTSINDKKLIMSKVSLLKGSGNFVKTKLTWNDRQKQKALSSLRFALVNLGLKRKLLRIMDLKLFYDGSVLDENLSSDVIFASFRSDLTSSVETSSDWLINNFFLLLNIQGMTSENKRVDLLTLLELHNIDLLFLSETWLKHLFDDDFCFLFGTFYVVTRADRIHGTHGGVIILCRRNSALNISEIIIDNNYDFVVAATLQNSHNSVALFIFFYLPPATSSYRIPFDSFSSCFEDVARKAKSFYPPDKLNMSLIVLGDFNFPDPDWSSMSNSNKRELEFLEYLNFPELLLLITSGQTHRCGNILDNIVTNVNFITGYSIEDNSLSHHSSITFNYSSEFNKPINIQLNIRSTTILTWWTFISPGNILVLLHILHKPTWTSSIRSFHGV